jgi:hypothetical protein
MLAYVTGYIYTTRQASSATSRFHSCFFRACRFSSFSAGFWVTSSWTPLGYGCVFKSCRVSSEQGGRISGEF